MKIPFAQPLGATNGENSDGVVYGSLAYAKPIAVITDSSSVPVTRAIRGNADDTGAVLYEDVTSALGSSDGSGVTIFDTVNPTADQLWIEVGENDSTTGFGMHVTVAGVYTGVVTCQVKYKSAAGVWVTVACELSGQLDSNGIKYITFPVISGTEMMAHDDLIDPVSGIASRKYQVMFTGITGVTTPPVVDKLIRTMPIDGSVKTELYGYSVDVVDDIPIEYDVLEVMAHIGDRTLVCFEAPFAKLKCSIKRNRLTADAKLIYSRADGSYGDITVLDMLSASTLRAGQWLTADPGASPVEYVDTFTPPSDWAATTIAANGNSYTGYWFGIEYTAADTAPALAMLVAFQAGMLIGSGGVEAESAATGVSFDVHVRNVSTSDSVFLIGNLDTGKSATSTLPAGAYSVESTGVPIAPGERFVIQQLAGSETSIPADGFFTVN